MEHRIFTNTSGEVKKHPLSGQIIMPGQSYTEPADQEPVELIDADGAVTVQTVADPKAFEKATRGARGPSRQTASSNQTEGNAATSNGGRAVVDGQGAGGAQ